MNKQDYEQLKTKHELPSFETLDKEFYISQIEAQTHILVEIKRKIAEKMEPTIDFLTGLLNPESFGHMFECKNFTRQDQKNILDTYRHLMEHYRLILESDIDSTDEAHANAIKLTTKSWLENKKTLLEVIGKTRCNWQEKIEPKEMLEYLG